MMIVGNWKMNGQQADGQQLIEALTAAPAMSGCEMVIAPPATMLSQAAGWLQGSAVGLAAQDCHAESSGAFTGSVSSEMLRDAGCEHIIVGHSERRTLLGETDADVQAKALAADRAGCTPIICIGETEQQYRDGDTKTVLETQLEGSVPKSGSIRSLIVAYEPVWAIGTGLTPSTDEIHAVHKAIGEKLAALGYADITLLYGGSVKPANASEILALDGVSGALVGGASLDAESFLAIARAGARIAA